MLISLDAYIFLLFSLKKKCLLDKKLLLFLWKKETAQEVIIMFLIFLKETTYKWMQIVDTIDFNIYNENEDMHTLVAFLKDNQACDPFIHHRLQHGC